MSEETERASSTDVVVGVDGSENGQAALDWAIDEAAARRARLVVVTVCHQPTVADAYLSQETFDAFEASAKDVLDQAVARAHERAPGVEVVGRFERGAPAAVLMDLAEGAGLLVVGRRGHGGFVGLLLGSVSSQVTHHAPCPVTVVTRRDGQPADQPAATAERSAP